MRRWLSEWTVDSMRFDPWSGVFVRTPWGTLEITWTPHASLGAAFPTEREIDAAYQRDESTRPNAYPEAVHEDLEERMLTADDLADLRNLVELPRAKA